MGSGPRDIRSGELCAANCPGNWPKLLLVGYPPNDPDVGVILRISGDCDAAKFC